MKLFSMYNPVNKSLQLFSTNSKMIFLFQPKKAIFDGNKRDFAHIEKKHYIFLFLSIFTYSFKQSYNNSIKKVSFYKSIRKTNSIPQCIHKRLYEMILCCCFVFDSAYNMILNESIYSINASSLVTYTTHTKQKERRGNKNKTQSFPQETTSKYFSTKKINKCREIISP